ncbi:MAG: hypothetical protein ABJG00_18245 [Lentilitoribacter sp.]
MDTFIPLKSLLEYSQEPVQQGIQTRLITFKEDERWWFKPLKKGSGWVEKTYSDENILNAIDKVCLFSNLQFYTPLRGDIGGRQIQRLSASMLGSRRWLTYFRMVDADGKMAHPPRDVMRPMVIAAFLRGHALLKSQKKFKRRR